MAKIFSLGDCSNPPADVGLLRLKGTDLKAWDVLVFVEYKDKIYDASYAVNGSIEPIDRQDFF